MTADLFDELDSVLERIRSAPAVWLGTDFDGTLVPHAANPGDVALDPQVMDLLRELGTLPRCRVAVVTGRSLADIRRLVAVHEIAYAGNHGLEIQALGLDHRDAAAVLAREPLERTALRLADELVGRPGITVQDKRFSLAVDYYASPMEIRRIAVAAIDAAIAGVPMLFARHGVHGSEVRPVGAGHKGTAALRLREHQSGPDALPIFLGDELTDEDAFEALPDGITIRVGDPRPTAARYCVDSPREVARFLHRLRDAIAS
ncbi:MAG: trehalose-phosphatase [Deltaproteobacteria bacterium]|nr:trehalose-phosphatase [Planctomycetia bacterium]MBX3160549.1 trehalose-phosphatase [Deltaproteobacteria bacterium]MBX3399866.1 trehalose-phosphatase [Gemmataceae bacterium]